MKMKRKRVWLLAGIPGSGKSTWVRKRIAERGGVHCSRDEIRFALLKDGEDYFAHEDAVVRLWKEKIADAISNPDVADVYIDATHLTEKSRAAVIDDLPNGNYSISIIFFDIPLETCLNRNWGRKGRAFVPTSVIRRMHMCYEKETKLGDKVAYIREENEDDIFNIRYTF